eukprot:s145_g5.t1
MGGSRRQGEAGEQEAWRSNKLEEKDALRTDAGPDGPAAAEIAGRTAGQSDYEETPDDFPFEVSREPLGNSTEVFNSKECAGPWADVAPDSYEAFLSFLSQAKDLKQFGIALAWGCHTGAIPVERFLEGRTKYLMEHPLECLLPVRERSVGSMQAKVHVVKGEELDVFRLLETRGVTSWLPAHEVYADENGVPNSLELHKGRAAPCWFTRVVSEATPLKAWWQVYLDNVMSAEKCEGTYDEVDVDLQTAALRAWHAAGVLTADDKQILGSAAATELGIRIDGARGFLGASAERIFNTCLASLKVLAGFGNNFKESQVVLGRWIFILQFRRPAMAVLSKAWGALEKPWPSVCARQELLRELQMLLCLGPILQADLRSEYDEKVSCSDALEHGGAAAISTGLTWTGNTLANTLRDSRKARIELPILVMTASNGVGATFRIYDILGIRPLGRSV